MEVNVFWQLPGSGVVRAQREAHVELIAVARGPGGSLTPPSREDTLRQGHFETAIYIRSTSIAQLKTRHLCPLRN